MGRVKHENGLFILLFFLLLEINIQGQDNSETLIALKNISVSPSDIAQPGSGIENIADGKCGNDREIFHTLWTGIPKQNIIIEADLIGKGKLLTKVILTPRAFGSNGIIKNAELWVSYNSKYQKVADIEGDLSNEPIKVELDNPIINPEKIKLVITDSYGDRNGNSYMVSLGELECIMSPKDTLIRAALIHDSKLFSDLTGTSLKANVTKNDIEKMKVPALKNFANQLYEHKYKADSLTAIIQPVLNPEILGKQMRVDNGFSKFEGITGIVLEKGDNVVFVGETKGAKIKLIVPDWTRKPSIKEKPENDPAGYGLKKQIFALRKGANLVHLQKGGNAYIQYFTDSDPDNFPSITVHFPTGRCNGYFDITRGDNNDDFNRLLTNVNSPILDMKGNYIQVAFPVDSLKKYTWGKGVELLKNYDTIISLQRHFIGWDKYGFAFKNHILARVNYHYYMFKDNDGVAFIDWAMKIVADPKSVITGDPCWGFCHEVGHIYQMRPQVTWGGMTEVSNNIITMFCTTSLGNRSRLTAEKRYAQARNTILDKGISYMDFPGVELNNTSQYGGTGNTDVFQRLVPFWQLYLYFKEIGYSDFYPDLFNALRKQPLLELESRNKEYLYMLNFCKLACEVSKTDLTDFFQRWGFFYVGEMDIADYNKYLYQVSQSDVDAVKSAISKMKLPKPKRDITLIED